MYKSYKYRIYPNEEQKILMDKHFGCVRFIYNLALETKIEAYRINKTNLTRYDLQKQLTDLKKDLQWLCEVSISALQGQLLQLDNAYNNFYKGRTKFPKFKRKRDKNSFSCTRYISIKGNKICIPKFQEGIRFIQHRDINGDIKSATVSKTSTGKYFISVLVKKEIQPLPKNNNILGIDLGIKTFAVTSEGTKYSSPKFLRKSLDRLVVLQRRASRKQGGSANRKKANLKVALLHEKINNQRADFLHNVSNEITNHYGVICIEDLAVSNMVKNHKLALSISDASWGEFAKQLSYKSGWKGRQLITIGRFEPSSKTCSSCGKIKDIKLSERVYNCICGLSIDRDYNASLNIKNLGILRANKSMELPEMSGTVK